MYHICRMYLFFSGPHSKGRWAREKAISERKETEPYLNRAVERTLQRRHEKREIWLPWDTNPKTRQWGHHFCRRPPKRTKFLQPLVSGLEDRAPFGTSLQRYGRPAPPWLVTRGNFLSPYPSVMR